MIPLCNVDGVASVLFTKRSGTMRAHKNEICFPGGKVTKIEAQCGRCFAVLRDFAVVPYRHPCLAI